MFNRRLKTPSITHVRGVGNVGERERIERPPRARLEVLGGVRLKHLHRARRARPGARPRSDILATVLMRHAVSIVAHFDWALAVTLAAPEASLRPLVSPGLSLDSCRGSGFLAAACVRARRLRPRRIPEQMGLDFFLVGYYAYRKVRASVERRGPELRIATSSGFDVKTNDQAVLPPMSVFADWDEARRYAGPMPFTFASADGGRAVVRVEGSRVHWEPRPVALVCATIPFLSRIVPDAVPAAAFLVEDVDYEWKRGIVERLAT
jgi:hypothetical protein